MARYTNGAPLNGVCLYLVLSLLCQSTSAAARAGSHLLTNRLRPAAAYENDPWSPLNYLATKALGAFVRVATIVYQWMPDFPNFLKPPKFKIRFADPSSLQKYDDDSRYDDFD